MSERRADSSSRPRRPQSAQEQRNELAQSAQEQRTQLALYKKARAAATRQFSHTTSSALSDAVVAFLQEHKERTTTRWQESVDE
eukprot:7080946-Prymnesium_polylepis.1